MKLPAGVTEQQVLDAIEKSARILAPSFSFGIYDQEDVKQEARMEGLRVMAKYDASRPLENYLYTCIRNRLIRLKRDKLRRNDPPCPRCHQGERHAEEPACVKHGAWKSRNDAKANLMRPLDLSRVAEQKERRGRVASVVEESAGARELLSLIDEQLEVGLRADYLRMLAGKGVSKGRRQAIEKAVREILKGDVDG